jgi:hypothetical protein
MKESKPIEVMNISEMQIRRGAKSWNQMRMPNPKEWCNTRNNNRKSLQLMKEYKRIGVTNTFEMQRRQES